MNKVNFQNSRGLNIVGNLNSVDSNTVIIMAHGFTSNKASRGRFDKLAEALNKAGYDALAIDFSGCGESDDDFLTVEKEVDDLNSAIQFVKSKGYERIALYGHSLGSLICLKCYSNEIVTMVLSGALTGPMKYNWDEFYTKEQMQELEEKGYLTEHTPKEVRKKVLVDKQILKDFEMINQENLLRDVNCPVLIIHGNNDEEEKQLYERSKSAMTLLSNDSKLKVIDGADHSFLEHFRILVVLTIDWYKKHLN
ncbi:alpha/beta fold hydrolase [Clostridium sp. D2Q-11]|uniref:Alpha/beta fold hydrolase n=1 Tax=Anaeromonas frigoriresistens TaxID=2683708 RepID=A0A942UZ45_9FIRM|nr:alpha/beta fold hydrolase [Anaeromonas frigoriresistens]MBS4538966.1 alpha/beta fold hydrolase [Anaeromonas frigoriresistens]